MLAHLGRRGVDAALEATILASFTKLGPAVRRSLWGWEPLGADALAGEIVVVTGGTSGLGVTIAEGVARAGASVVLVGRSEDRGRDVAARLRDEGGAARFVAADVGELDDVRRLADEVLGMDAPLAAVVHNAGALLGERRTTSTGLEVTWASMVVGPHLLTRLLADAADRVIWMSSGGMYLQDLDLDDWGWERRGWDGTRAYAQAKRAQVDLVAEAAERGEEPLQVAMHPGWADTPGVEQGLPGFRKVMGPLLRSPEAGSDTAVWLCGAPRRELTAGAFYLDRRPRGTVRWPGTRTSPADRHRLRALVDAQAGLA